MLNKCLNKPRIIRDRAGWLEEGVEQLGLEQEHQKHGEEAWWKGSCLHEASHRHILP
ncbi:MAG: hypothetical protein QXP91_03780 [Candidatus Methanomethylicia archaeon]